MITIEQIRAGRAMLNWTQKQLAEAANISLRNLNNIEAGLVTPRLETLRAIQSTLEKSCIEFMDGNAIRLRQDIFEMEKHEGVGALEFIFQDLIEAYRGGVRELMLCNTNDTLWLKNSSPKTVEDYCRALERYDAKERCLMAHGDKNFIGPPSAFRWLPKEYYSEVPYFVYGITLALIVWEPVLRIAVIRNQAIADSFRRHFELAWSQAEIPAFARLAQKNPTLDKARIWLSEKEIARLEQAED